MTLTIPYAPRRMYEPDGSIAELVRRSGQAQAEGIRRGGDISANMWGSLGQIGSQAVSEYSRQRQEQAEMKRQQDAADAKARAEAPRIADEAKMRGLNIRKTEMDIQSAEAEAQAEAQRAAKMAEIFSRDSEPSAKELIVTLGDKRGIAAWEALRTMKDGSEKQFKDQNELLKKGLQGLAALPEEVRAPAYAAMRQNYLRRNLIGEDMAPPEYSPEWFSQALNFGEAPKEPKAAEAFSLSPGQVRFGPDGKPLASVPREPRVGREDNKIWVMRPGPDGKPETLFVPESQVRPGDQPANTRTGEGRPSTGTEKRVLNFFNRAKQADEELTALQDTMSKQGLFGQTYQALAPNFMQTQEGQAYIAAQRAFTEARLRKDSGAAIPEQEFKNDRQTYFQQPGDSQTTIAQKARARAAILSSLAFESGRAMTEFYGDDAEDLAGSYKQRSASPDKANTVGGEAKPRQVRMSATNPKTGEKLYSDDGGATWHK